MLLYIVRHGDPDYKTDSLTPLGRRQAEAVGRRIMRARVDRIYASTMGRALETARPAAELLKKEIVPLDWAREIRGDVVQADGSKISLALYPAAFTRNAANMNIGYDDSLKADGFRDSGLEEGYHKVIDGARGFLAECGYVEENGIFRVERHNDERVALFCHGNMGRTLLSYLLHIPVHIMWSSFMMSHTAVSVVKFVEYDNGYAVPRCIQFADLSHLAEDGQTLAYTSMTGERIYL